MEIMKPFRTRIDALDDQIVDLLAQRVDIIREVGAFKYKNDIPSVLQDRVTEVIERVVAYGEEKKIDPDLMRTLYTKIVKFSCDLEDEIKDELARKETSAA